MADNKITVRNPKDGETKKINRNDAETYFAMGWVEVKEPINYVFQKVK